MMRKILQLVISPSVGIIRDVYLKSSLVRSMEKQHWIDTGILSGSANLGRERTALVEYLAHSQ
jgi:hypothetical protein